MNQSLHLRPLHAAGLRGGSQGAIQGAPSVRLVTRGIFHCLETGLGFASISQNKMLGEWAQFMPKSSCLLIGWAIPQAQHMAWIRRIPPL